MLSTLNFNEIVRKFQKTRITMRKCVTKSYDNSIAPFRPGHLKFRFSEKATKITKKSPIVLTLLSKCQKNWEIFFQILWPSHDVLILKDLSFEFAQLAAKKCATCLLGRLFQSRFAFQSNSVKNCQQKQRSELDIWAQMQFFFF